MNLLTSQQFTNEVKLRKFFLLNLFADPFGFEVKFCCTALQSINLFPCYNEYAVLYINHEPQGLYLLVERPIDATQRN